MKNQLSKREYKYRCKIIAENHLKKDYQEYLDEQVQAKGITYKVLYFDPMRLRSILSVVAFRKCSDAIRKIGVSAKQAADAFNNFACVANAVSQAVEVDGIVSNLKRTYELSDEQADELLKLAEDYAMRHITTCGDVLYEIGRKIREDGYTIQRCIKWLKEV